MPKLNADQLMRLMKKRANADEKPKKSKKEEERKAKEEEVEQRRRDHRQRLTWQPAPSKKLL